MRLSSLMRTRTHLTPMFLDEEYGIVNHFHVYFPLKSFKHRRQRGSRQWRVWSHFVMVSGAAWAGQGESRG